MSRAFALLLLLRRRRLSCHRRFGIHPINRRRTRLVELNRLMPELRADPERFLRYFRMSEGTFDQLLELLQSGLTKRSQRMPITPEHRLEVTLRFLATGATFQHLAFSFRMGVSTIHNIVKETCDVIWCRLSPTYVRTPSTTDEWLRIAREFEDRWQLPHCLGAIDGKHVRLVSPPKSGSLYYNYKGSFSIVLLAVCDARYRVIYMDAGSYGHARDAGIFDNSALKRAIDSGELNLPGPAPITGTNRVLPYFFVGDAAFPLSERMMKPFVNAGQLDQRRRLYNYRLSRGRRVVENLFGLLCVKWRVLLSTMQVHPDMADRVVKAICALHNFLIDESPAGEAHPTSLVDDDDDNGPWRAQVNPLEQAALRRRGNNRASHASTDFRESLVQYFNAEGAVPWQLARIAADSDSESDE